tara:strand:- start:599 stop:715 length:117 start_codon:yes stop_codon:yes gene_type:complete
MNIIYDLFMSDEEDPKKKLDINTMCPETEEEDPKKKLD